MANVSFDGVGRIIAVTLPPTGGLVSLEVKTDLYSEWKAWVKLSDNSKYPIAFRSVGGDPVSAELSLGATYFLMNGWRIRPYEASHRFVLTGNLFTDPSGFSPVVPTVSASNVVVEYSTSTLVSAVEANALLLSKIQNVYNEVL